MVGYIIIPTKFIRYSSRYYIDSGNAWLSQEQGWPVGAHLIESQGQGSIESVERPPPPPPPTFPHPHI